MAKSIRKEQSSKQQQKTGYVAYYRVSTDKQGESGLGLEAQQEAVRRIAKQAPVLAEYTEVESGKRHTNRPQLYAAMADAKQRGATLLIAKLDRLARNVHFISGLMESGIDFLAADMPHANRLTVHIMAAFAEHEARAISERTKAALAALKARGVKLGNPHWRDYIEKARQARIDQIEKPSAAVVDMIHRHRMEGGTLRAIADRLNSVGLRTPRGGRWHATTVRSAMRIADVPMTPVSLKLPVPAETAEMIRRHRDEGKSLRAIADAMNAAGVKTPTGASWYASTVRAALLAA
jgi:DNA invertase Pin-like site-specific DNA recombinase